MGYRWKKRSYLNRDILECKSKPSKPKTGSGNLNRDILECKCRRLKCYVWPEKI